jgi:hypothetical protein
LSEPSNTESPVWLSNSVSTIQSRAAKSMPEDERSLRPPTTARAATTTAGIAIQRFTRRGRRARGAPVGCQPVGSAAANCWAVVNRSAGARASAFASAASTVGGTDSRMTETLGSGSVMRRAKIACAVGPVNGGSPASIS